VADVRIIARSAHGIEWVCADEIAGHLPAARDVALTRREVTFTLPDLTPAVTGLRTVDDVFLEIGRVDGAGTTKDTVAPLARRLAGLALPAGLAELARIRELPADPSYDVVVSLEGRRTYTRFAVADAVGAELAGALGGPYVRRGPDGPAAPSALTVRVFVRGGTAVLALRVAGRPLHRREYKQDTGPGTLHPPFAAALLRLAAPADSAVVVDPFCGDGTIAIEAELAYPGTTVVGADIDPVRLAAACGNAHRAGARVALLRADVVGSPLRRGAADVVVTNPPWSVAVDAGGGLRGRLDGFWARLPDLLAASGRAVLVTGVDAAAPAAARAAGLTVGLATRVRLAGRVCDLVLCGPAAAVLPAGPARWRERALAAGVVTEAGF
jgi:tRNA (guanine6-N2)-methyltransferase